MKPIDYFRRTFTFIPAVGILLLSPVGRAYTAPDIRLRTAAISTGDVKAVSALAQSFMDREGKVQMLLQFNGPPRTEWKAQMHALGVEFYDYIPEWAYVVRMPRSNVRKVLDLPFVHWIGPFKGDYKILTRPSGKARFFDAAISLFPSANPKAVASRIRALGGKILSGAGSGRDMRALLPTDSLDKVAAMESVRAIEEFQQPRLLNNVAQQITNIDDARLQVGLFGEGQIIGIADTGLDVGSTGSMSADFAGRILYAYALRRPGDWSDLNGHGTHTAGIAFGSGVLSGSNPAAHAYNNSFAGAAPEAQIVYQSIGDESRFVYPPIDLNDLFGPAYSDGARVHSNSWGSDSEGAYTLQARQVDDFIWNHPDFTVVFAVGNDGVDKNPSNGVVDLGGLYAPATAKNCISVSASESYRLTGGWQATYGGAWPSDYPLDPIKSDRMSNVLPENNYKGMAAFSSRGPAADGRMKPDLCAPGTNIISCRSHMPETETGWGVYNDHYIYWGGTSLAAPLVAGAAALVRESYIKNVQTQPSAALVKATLINTAADMSPGQYGTGAYREMPNRPNNVEGWGRLDMIAAVSPAAPRILDFLDEGAGIETGQTRHYSYQVLSSAEPLKVTLVWSDPPGSMLPEKQLVNNLDLIVTSPNLVQYRGNSAVDSTNNVEGVDVSSPQVGTWDVAVAGANVPQGPQPFALVVTGHLPGEYISGTVTSAGGHPIPGVEITVSGSITKKTTTGLGGQYTVRVPTGEYTITPSLAGWSFSPPLRNVTVQTPGITGVDFTGTGTPGDISGAVERAAGGVTEYILESPHGYPDHCNMTWTITAHPSATSIKVHFAEIATQEGADFVEVLSQNDELMNRYTGSLSDVWSNWTDGNVIKVRLTSDAQLVDYGFYIDGYQTNLIPQGAQGGVTLTATPGGASTQSQLNGQYSITGLEPLSYEVTPSLAPWHFQPASQLASVPPGGTAGDVNFNAYPPGAITGMVKAGRESPTSLDPYVESEHEYENNYWNVWTIEGPPTAARMHVHFTEIEVEPGYDFVYVMDGPENTVYEYTGTYNDEWSPWVDGNVIKVALSSDENYTFWGFRVDKYAALVDVAPIPGATARVEPSGPSDTSDATGQYTLQNVETGLRTVSVCKDHWTFTPDQANVNVAADQTGAAPVFWGTLDVMYSAALLKCEPDGVQVRLNGAIVTAGTDDFSGFCYVEDADRTSAIRVVTTVPVTQGQIVNVEGVLQTVNGERQIAASSVL